MRSLISHFRSHTLTFAATFSTLTFGLLAPGARGSDRFVVPTSPTETQSSPSPSSSNSGGSYSPSPSSNSGSNYSPPPTSDSGRFTIPVSPGPSNPSFPPALPPGGGGSIPGGGGHPGGPPHYYPPYWGGCYYWGGNYYYWGGSYYRSAYGDFGFYGYYPSSYYASGYDRPSGQNGVPIFFPPSPPPIGAPIPPKQNLGQRTAAPEKLASFVYEPFYAPLSTRFAEQDLSKKLLSRIDTYQTKRSALQNELQAKLASLQEATPEDRIQELESFAREQSPRIAALEETAEQLRSDLLRGGLMGVFSGSGDWNQTRNWDLSGNMTPSIRKKTLAHEFLVMRAAVFYQEGLSPAQRRLLREVAMELQIEAFKPKAEPDSDKGDETLVFFSPETARIRITDDLPADIATKLAVYQSEKNAVKAELRDTLYQQDSASSSKRVQMLKQLAETQAARIATLEGLADDIRASLSRLPNQTGPTKAPPFPPELARRISEYEKEKLEMQKMLQAKMEEIRIRFAPDAKFLRKKSADGEKLLYRLEGGQERLPFEKTAIRDAIAEVNRENAERYIHMNKEKESIRSEIAAYVAAHPETTGEKSVQTLLKNFVNALQEEESWQPYKDYQTAVYQPGLSPEQRRLLFEVALEKLALPLPEGEFQ